jgi:lipopolysaccharide export system permease protein
MPRKGARVPRFDRYLLSQLLTLFGLTALVLILVYWVNRAVVLFDQIISDGQGIRVFLELTALSLPPLIGIVVPVAACIAPIYAANRLMADSELVVVQATGFSAFRLARPVLIFGLIVTLLLSILTHILIPQSQARLKEREAEIAQTATARLLREGQFLNPAEGITVYIREVTPEGELRDIFLNDSRSVTESITYTAARAFLVRGPRGPQLVMIDGLAQTLRHADQSLGTTAFEDFAYDVGDLMPQGEAVQRRANTLSTAELLFPTPALEAETGETAGDLIVRGHSRFADALLATVGALLGFATMMTGGFSRFGSWRQVVSAIFLIILVKLVESAVTGPVTANPALWPLLYLPSSFGLLVAWGLLFAAERPWLFRRRARAPA